MVPGFQDILQVSAAGDEPEKVGGVVTQAEIAVQLSVEQRATLLAVRKYLGIPVA
jgi:hypothetical protein